MIWQTLCNGGSIGFVTPHYDMPTFYADCQLLRPVLMVAMPDFWNGPLHPPLFGIVVGVCCSLDISSCFIGLFAEYGNRLVAVLEKIPKSAPPKQVLEVQSKVLQEVNGLLGGRIVATGTGGARISTAVLDFMERCFGSKPTNAYGTTEASGISSNGYAFISHFLRDGAHTLPGCAGF